MQESVFPNGISEVGDAGNRGEECHSYSKPGYNNTWMTGTNNIHTILAANCYEPVFLSLHTSRKLMAYAGIILRRGQYFLFMADASDPFFLSSPFYDSSLASNLITLYLVPARIYLISVRP